MDHQEYQIGMIGLGVMGSNLALNLSDHGYSVIGYDKDAKRVEAMQSRDESRIHATTHIEEFIQHLRSPHIIIILVPAGKAIDAVIQTLMPYLKRGDILIDGGNSYFIDTEKRQIQLAEKGIFLLGMGISGGESGARQGPSLMIGGDANAYQKVQSMLESIVPHVNEKPCAAYLGHNGAGHYVKMVHNGIEYGLMQLIAECYDIMKRGLGLDEKAIHQVFSDWSESKLTGFLVEITAQILQHIDPQTKDYLIDQIVDVAEETGTGFWTSEEGLKLHEPLPTINASVVMRDLSAFKMLREDMSECLAGPSQEFKGNKEEFLIQLSHALYAGMIIVYNQGFSLLREASKIYEYNFNLETIAQIWCEGCIIRSNLLQYIEKVFRDQPHSLSLLLDPYFSQELSRVQEDLREVIAKVALLGISIPSLMASLCYYDAFRSRWLPANLIQAQRDYFGSHTYKRVDKKGAFHAKWSLSNL